MFFPPFWIPMYLQSRFFNYSSAMQSTTPGLRRRTPRWPTGGTACTHRVCRPGRPSWKNRWKNTCFCVYKKFHHCFSVRCFLPLFAKLQSRVACSTRGWGKGCIIVWPSGRNMSILFFFAVYCFWVSAKRKKYQTPDLTVFKVFPHSSPDFPPISSGFATPCRLCCICT